MSFEYFLGDLRKDIIAEFKEYLDNINIGMVVQEFIERYDLTEFMKGKFHEPVLYNEKALKDQMKQQLEAILEERLRTQELQSDQQATNYVIKIEFDDVNGEFDMEFFKRLIADNFSFGFRITLNKRVKGQCLQCEKMGIIKYTLGNDEFYSCKDHQKDVETIIGYSVYPDKFDKNEVD